MNFIVLAAGRGRRMGLSKGLLDAGGVPLVCRHVEAAHKVAARVVVVLGAEAAAHRLALAGTGAEVVENPAWDSTWPLDSLRCALSVLGTAHPAFVAPVDTPPALPATLAALLAAGAPAVPIGPDGAEGHPALVDPATLIRAWGPALDGLRGLLVGAPRVAVDDPDVARDADTPEDWSAWGVATARWTR